jgi:hypothetical protein
MKRYLTFIVLLLCSIVSAQNISDVLRYSSENIQGTARYQGMGGAFGALGGDLSALNINPAGSVIFNNNLGTISGSFMNRDNTNSYNGSSKFSSANNADINQAGGVLVFKTSEPLSVWNKVSIAFNYDITENFDNYIDAVGTSTEGIDNYFLNFAEGVPLGDILLRDGEFIEEAYLDIGSSLGFGDQQAFLGYFGGLIDPFTTPNNNEIYVSNADYSTVNQEFSRITTGYNSKFTLNGAAQYKERFNIGASLNFHTIFATKSDQFTETGYDTNSVIQRTTFDNNILTEGTGFSLSFGAIAKLSDLVRVGASYQSPTWYRLQDELGQRISSDLADDDIDFINFDQVNIFPRYTLKVPGKLTGSLALIFAKNGLLSFDYSAQDYSNVKLGPGDDPDFAAVNSDASRDFGLLSSMRVGGEYRIDKISLRAGYRFDESPYENLSTVGDLQSISGGIGYNFGSSRLDFALSRTERDTSERLFDTGINTPVLINGVAMNGTLSYTVNF